MVEILEKHQQELPKKCSILNSPHSPLIEKENKGKVVDEVPPDRDVCL
jgi:hypothetical protein